MDNNHVAVREKPLFIKDTHELSNLLRHVKKGSKAAVELLISTMNTKGDDVSLKTRLDCARAILDLEMGLEKQIAHDQMARQIAELKAKGYTGGQSGQGTTVGGSKPLPPITDFSTIQEVN